MRRRMLFLSVPVLALFVVGCAAIFGGGSKQKVEISSTPEQASYKVLTTLNVEVASGHTPETVSLARKREYVVHIALDGYKEAQIPLEHGTNGWVWGNLLCGGLIGLIVDFSTGAAYKLEPDQVHLELVTARYGDSSTEKYAVLTRVDDQGQLRVLPVPLIPKQLMADAN
jgi:hypothetical protein